MSDGERAVEESRQKILAAIAGASSVTFLRSYGNIGDHLIFAGTRKLLAGLPYQEASLLRLNGVSGDLALVSGGGAWCAPYHDLPLLLGEVERRFRRVIVLPSSFDVSVPAVLEALQSTRATVFAREEESFQAIRPYCSAELAHDAAFFFDYRPYRRAGEGTLIAFRTDREATTDEVPPGNDDISVTCESLDEWLWTIARHERVLTDRAHVLIASALLGKTVEYAPSVYHKVTGIAAFALRDFPVRRIERPVGLTLAAAPTGRALDGGVEGVRARVLARAQESLASLPPGFFDSHREAQVTAVVLTYGSTERAIESVQSLRTHTRIPLRILLLDNGCQPPDRERLRAAFGGQEWIDLVVSDRNLGCAGGRVHAVKMVRTPYVLLLDDDVETFPASVEKLLAALEAHPDALAACGKVVLDDGTIHLFGGEYRTVKDLLTYDLLGAGKPLDDPELGSSGACRWVSGTATLFRTEALRNHPLDTELSYYYQDLEWCYRLDRGGEGRFLRDGGAWFLHHHRSRTADVRRPLAERKRTCLEFLLTLARFHDLHGKVIQNFPDFVPGFPRTPGAEDVAAARLALSLLSARGGEWFFEQWSNGALDPLLAPGSSHLEQRCRRLEETLRGIREAAVRIPPRLHLGRLRRSGRKRRPADWARTAFGLGLAAPGIGTAFRRLARSGHPSLRSVLVRAPVVLETSPGATVDLLRSVFLSWRPLRISARCSVPHREGYAGVQVRVPVDSGASYRVSARAWGSGGSCLEFSDRSRGDACILAGFTLEEVPLLVSFQLKATGDLLLLFACQTTYGPHPSGWIRFDDLTVEPSEEGKT